MKGKLSLIAVMVATLLLAGCLTVKVDTDIRPDGSGVKSLIMAVDDDVLEMASTAEPGATPENPFADLREEVADVPGVTVEEYHDAERGRTGLKMSVEFRDVDELPAISAEKPFDGLDSITIERDGSVYTLRAAVNTDELNNELAAAAGEGQESGATPSPDELKMQEQIMEAMDVEFTYSVKVPGKLIAYGPVDNAIVEGNRVTWQLDLLGTDPANLMVQWDSKGKPSGPPPAQSPAAETPSAQPTDAGAGKGPISFTGCPLAGLLPFGMVASAALWRKRRASPM